jgi:hypothetical protein
VVALWIVNGSTSEPTSRPSSQNTTRQAQDPDHPKSSLPYFIIGSVVVGGAFIIMVAKCIEHSHLRPKASSTHPEDHTNNPTFITITTTLNKTAPSSEYPSPDISDSESIASQEEWLVSEVSLKSEAKQPAKVHSMKSMSSYTLSHQPSEKGLTKSISPVPSNQNLSFLSSLGNSSRRSLPCIDLPSSCKSSLGY